jgi:hypothetical protein
MQNVDVTKSLARLIWPETTSEWYPTGMSRSVFPHNFHELTTPGKMAACQNAVQGYLSALFGFDPPREWFKEAQFRVLFEELKHLVGETSSAQGNGGRNGTIGSAALLLVAANGANARHWINAIMWDRQTDEILPKQTREQSRTAILALATLFEALALHDPVGSVRVHQVVMERSRLRIWLDFDCTDARPGRPSLLDKVVSLNANSADTHQAMVYTAYKRFLITSALNEDGGREARCVLNLKPVEGQGKRTPPQTLLEIVPCN